LVGVPLNNMNTWKAPPKQAAKPGIVLNKEEPLRRNAALQKRLGDRACAWSKLDDRSRVAGIDIARHHARQKWSRRGDRAGKSWVVEPRHEKARLIGEPQFDWRCGFSWAARVGQRGWPRQEQRPSLKLRQPLRSRIRRQ